ncbi:hypothetical protein [Coraliomargarita parva]|uniref:hypothetical protein n=1 Tax=Coraliomargarita parva TaxID=3014050 RepID=UPI0022B58A54|nr:hypothetical protein [Coraliomargarita parva]
MCIANCPSQRTLPSKSGFALIIAISLMAFVLLLVVSIATFIRVESSNSLVIQQRLQAEENARLSLMIALGELQKHAGPDQRVSARSDVTGDAAEAAGNRFWLGIWDSTQSAAAPVWLVSGNEGLAATDPDYVNPDIALADPAVSDQVVWMVDDGSVSQASDRVKVPRRSIVNTSLDGSGGYAFWVGDDGVKAKVNILSEDNTPSISQNASPTVVSYGYGINQVDAEFENDDFEDDARLENLATLDSLSTLTSGASVARDYFHDLSVDSYGVLSDTKNGGLKQDLTAAFESDTVFLREFGDPNVQPMLSSLRLVDDIVDASGNPTGPNWSILRDYYLHYQTLTGGNSMAQIPAQPKLNTTAVRYDYFPYKHGNPAFGLEDNYQMNSPVTPVLAGLQFDFSIKSVRQGSGNYKLYIGMRPVIRIYNPYNVSIDTSFYRFYMRLNPKFKITVGSQVIEEDFVSMGLTESSSDRGYYITQTSSPYDLKPGETRIFSTNSSKNLVPTYLANGYYYDEITSQEFGPDEEVVINSVELLSDADLADDKLDFYIVLRKINPSWIGDLDIHRFAKLYQADADKKPPTVDDEIAPFFVSSASNQSGVYLASWSFMMPTSREVNGFRNMVDQNLRALAGDADWDGFKDGNGNTSMGMYSAQQDHGLLSGAVPPEAWDTNRYSGYWGSSTATGGQRFVVLFNVPREPLLSIGELQHANLSRYSSDPGWIVGNSYANPRIPLGQVVNSNFANYTVYDLPYRINEALWDSYFFSSIDPSLSEADFSDLYTDGLQRNKRYEFAYELQDLIDANAFSDSEANAQAYKALASWMMVNGPFNINSTSVKAWVALLSSMKDLKLPVYDPTDGTSVNESASLYFSRLSRPYGSDYQSNSGSAGDAEAFWRGYHVLSQQQIENLAVEIVNRIKERGRPFLSLAEFVNRSLVDLGSTVEDERVSGILQRALDAPASSINDVLDNALSLDADGPEDSPFPVASSGKQATNAPGYLLQSDVLQALGPILTARSDTFIIRGYGDCVDPLTDTITNRAYCEAVVQRYPDPIEGDRSDLSNRNLPVGDFGRAFRIVKFRWLNPEDV